MMIFFKNSDNDSKLSEVNDLILNDNLYFVAQEEVGIDHCTTRVIMVDLYEEIGE
jgi:hypothetical protein